MSTEKDFLVAKLGEVARWARGRFVVNFDPRTPDAAGYQPSFPHFEAVCSGVLPLTLPDGAGFRELALVPGDVLYLAPKAWVGRGMDTERELLVVNLHHDGVECYFSQHRPELLGGPMPRRSCLTASPPDLGTQHLLKAFEHYSREGAPAMRDCLFAVFLEAVKNHLEADQGGGGAKPSHVYKMILAHLRDNCGACLGREAVAREFGISPDYITHLFRRHGELSFNHALLQFRMGRAAELLGRKNLNVNEVAALCGFAEASYFIKVFRRFHGLTPARYRSRLVV